jgi:Putative adhesin
VNTRRPVSGAWFLAAIWVAASALTPAVARAQTQDLDGLGNGPIVRIIVGQGSVNVRTWDRPAVGIDDPNALKVKRFNVEANAAQSAVPILAGHMGGPDGPVDLPAESFAVSTLAPGRHDVVTLRAPDANVNVTVPQNASLVTVQMGKGNVSLSDYRGGTFVARVHNGSAHLQNVGGDGYVQVMNGPITADASSFNRLRMRSGTGDVVFQNCRAKQIEVSSVHGSIVYDGGSFQPGLARFETQTGNVALGVNGSSQLAAHASPGHVFTSFEGGTKVSGHEGEQSVVTGNGGPLVNAASGSGNVYLYNGQIASHRVAPEWQPVRSALIQTGRPAPALVAPAMRTVPAAASHAAPSKAHVTARQGHNVPAPQHKKSAPQGTRVAKQPPKRAFAAPPHSAAEPRHSVEAPKHSAAAPQRQFGGPPRTFTVPPPNTFAPPKDRRGYPEPPRNQAQPQPQPQPRNQAQPPRTFAAPPRYSAPREHPRKMDAPNPYRAPDAAPPRHEGRHGGGKPPGY